MALMAGSYIAFIFFTGDWHIYGIYFRYLLSILFLALAGRAFVRVKKLPFWKKSNPREKFGYYFISFFSLFFLALTGWAVWGQSFSAEPVSLQFPLKQGRYFVMEGGDSPLINQRFHTNPPTPKKYAIGIGKVFGSGRRASGLFPENPEAYAVYGTEVFSPCNGIVREKVDSLANLNEADSLSEMQMLGNYITIQSGDLQITLSQLQMGSIPVEIGDSISIGQPVGSVGNSGEAPEPLLLIFATRKNHDAFWRQYFDREGVPMLFNERFLTKNSIFDAP